jgi:hypothetical protein
MEKQLLNFIDSHLSVCDRLIANQRAFVARLTEFGADSSDAEADISESIRIKTQIEEQKKLFLSLEGK